MTDSRPPLRVIRTAAPEVVHDLDPVDGREGFLRAEERERYQLPFGLKTLRDGQIAALCVGLCFAAAGIGVLLVWAYQS